MVIFGESTWGTSKALPAVLIIERRKGMMRLVGNLEKPVDDMGPANYYGKCNTARGVSRRWRPERVCPRHSIRPQGETLGSSRYSRLGGLSGVGY